MATGPAYMNATPHHSKVKVSLTLSSPLFVAGQDVTGKMEMECRADSGVGIGLIMVELFAIQELNSRDHSASSTFLHTRRLFQGSGLPPSNAVSAHPIPGAPPLPEGYFPARRGMTTFFFRFPTPLSSPSSISFASGLAKIRYEVRANVGVAHRGEKRVVTDNVEADVVQCEDMDGTAAEHVVVGENGKMYVHGRIIGGRIISGQQACLELRVKNQSSKKTSGLSLILTRTLVLHNAATNSRAPLQLSDTLFSQTFRGAEYSMQAGAEGVANLVFEVPKAARAVKGGIRYGADDDEGGRRRTEALFEIHCILRVKIGMGIGNKEVAFEMPVQLSHPAALSEPSPNMEAYGSPAVDAYASSQNPFHHDPLPRAMSPILEIRNPGYGQSPGPGPMSTSPSYPYVSPPLPSPNPPMQHYQPAFPVPTHPHAPHQQLWSPPPPAMSPLPYFPDRSQAYYFPNPLMGLIPFAYPARPNSAGAGPSHNTSSGMTGGLSGVDAVSTVYPTFQQRREQLQARSASHQHPPAEPMVKDEGTEEGKGERASRISHHLRMSSRARSMSPTSHRFPVIPPDLPGGVATLHVTNLRYQACPPVLSPRPISSPRNSFSPDMAEINGVSNIQGTARSGRVDLLERLVDPAPGEEGKSVEEVLKDLERAEKEIDKTLPKPPVPTGKPLVSKGLLGVPKASDVFGEHSAEERAQGMAQDKPVKSVLRPSPVARRINIDNKGRENGGGRNNELDVGADLSKRKLDQPSSGLDVLEKRLLIEVGTRKAEASNRPTLFQVGLLKDAPTTSRSADASSQPKGGDPDVSSPVLASNGSTERESKKAGSTSTSAPVLGPATSHNVDEETIPSLQALRDIKEHSPARQKDRPKGEKAKGQEVIKLRKAAKNRVADWLAIQSRSNAVEEEVVPGPSIRPVEGVTAPDDRLRDSRPPNDTTSPDQVSQSQPVELPSTSEKIESKLSQPPEKPDIRHGEPLSKTKPTAVPLHSIAPSVPPKPPRLRKSVALVDEAQSEGRALNQTTGMDPPKLRVPQLSSPVSPERNYDVRSARGGKGGITTSVVALWTSLAEVANKDAQSVRPIKPATKPVTRNPATRPAFLDVGKAKASPAVARSSPKTFNDSVTPSPPATNTQPLQAENAMKSASAPAAVVPSHAKPHLSSTASLARPTSIPFSRPKPPPLSPTIVDSRLEESSNHTRPVVARDMAFGQARLKDLIKKYQQAAS